MISQRKRFKKVFVGVLTVWAGLIGPIVSIWCSFMATQNVALAVVLSTAIAFLVVLSMLMFDPDIRSI